MAQVSRPSQIALGAIVVLGLIWAIALRSHASNPSVSSNGSATSASTPSSGAGAANGSKGVGAPTSIYHGSAPGVEGLTRAIAKAHGAVAASERNAHEFESRSSAATGEPQAQSGSTAAQAKADGGSHATSQTRARHAATTGTHGPGAARHPGVSRQQAAVEGELASGKTVILLFWNPSSLVDQEVRTQTAALAGHSHGNVTLHVALAHQVGLFGAITEVAHVYQTPTILIVNKHGVVSTLTGLTDVFSLEQAVREARSAG